jgi:hypothetical protein
MGYLISWWAGLPWQLRVVVPLVLIAISTIFLFAGEIWPWGWVVGVILLCFAGPSSSEKKGYRF